MSIDYSTHSLFGVSKCAGDLLAQEYGRNIGLKTGVFRAGCITGPQQSGTELHGFLNYLVKVNLAKSHYNIFGFKGKQVRDNIHSSDVIQFMDLFIVNPRIAEVYNIGGGKDAWDNLVTACRRCNSEKSDLTLEEYGKEIPQPRRPHYLMLMRQTSHIPSEWEDYLLF